MIKTTDKVERGDWQTPAELAQAVCRLARKFIDPDAILEPNCGQGAFVLAAAKAFPNAKRIWAGDVNAQYVQNVKKINDSRVVVQKAASTSMACLSASSQYWFACSILVIPRA